MQVVILAAGKGSRLGPLTYPRSKAMMPVLGLPIVHRVVETLAPYDIDEVILVINPEDYRIRRYYSSGFQDRIRIRWAVQDAPLGTADALRSAARWIEGDFILCACDNLISSRDVGRLFARWVDRPRPSAVLSLLQVHAGEGMGSAFVVVAGDRVTRIVEKPHRSERPSDLISLPFYCLPPRILTYVGQVQRSVRGEYEIQDAIQMLINDTANVVGVQVRSRLALTYPADLLPINRYYLHKLGSRRPSADAQVEAGMQLIDPVWVEENVKIGVGSRIGPDVYLEAGSQLGDHVRIRDTVVLRGVRVPARSEVVHQVLV